MRALQEISAELLSPKGLHETLETVIRRAIDLFVCDAGSLYLRDGQGLYFEVAVNESKAINFERHKLSNQVGLARHSYEAGQAVRIADVYSLPKSAPYRFDSTFDQKVGYRTKSVLVYPIRNMAGEVIGVVQLINRKRRRGQKWPVTNAAELRKMPAFTIQDERLLASFAAVVSAAIENARLNKNIQDLFEGFVTASVQAIESRDLATRGHSDRVAYLTVDLAKMVDRDESRELRDFRFTKAQLSEIRYAALLHDFGKIGVREDTLNKEEKLLPTQKLEIRARFDGFRAAAEVSSLREYLNQLVRENRAPNEFEMKALEKRIREFGLKIEDYWALVLSLNEPTILAEDKSKRLDELSHVHCVDCHGKSQPLLQESEVFCLKIKRGSLTDDERREIESHVTHTYEYLKKIPWTPDLAGIPEIAYGHHERVDGRGYPRKIGAGDIPVQSRIMAVCDIFDALVASDRPYKPSLPVEKALAILEDQGRTGGLEPAVVKAFVEGRVYESPDFAKLCPHLKVNKKAA